MVTVLEENLNKKRKTTLDKILEKRYIDFQTNKAGKDWDDLKKELI